MAERCDQGMHWQRALGGKQREHVCLRLSDAQLSKLVGQICADVVRSAFKDAYQRSICHVAMMRSRMICRQRPAH
jgi:hypothetical protein